MNIETYRIYQNRPKPLMYFPIVYCIPGFWLHGVTADYVRQSIRRQHPNISEMHTMEYAGSAYIGIKE